MNVYVLQTARELGRRGNTVDVFTRVHDPNEPQVVELGDNARVVHLQAGPCHAEKLGLHQYIPEFLSNLYRFQRSEGIDYDLIHSHYWLSGSVAVQLSNKWGVPHVTTFHTLAKTKMQSRPGEIEPETRVTAETRVMRSVDAVVVSTVQEREDLSRLYRLSPHKVHVLPAGVDLRLFRPLDKRAARRRLGLTETMIVLSVGRIEPLKGLDILIHAMAALEEPVDTRLLVVGGTPGEDPELERLESLASGLGIRDMVTFTGAVDQTDLPAYYSAADVFVMPSYYESFGLAALESMACGTPVIASRVGGPKTFVKEGETGYLIPWHCPEPFAQRIEMLLSNPAMRSVIGASARQKAETMGWDRMADHMVELYSRVVRETWVDVAGA